MSIKSLLTSIFRTNRNSTKKPNRSRLHVEGLEGRDLMSAVLVVNTTADVLGHNNGQLSLRQAILDANAAGGTAADPVRIAFNLPANEGHFYYQNDGVAGQVTLGKKTATTAADDSALVNADPDWNHGWWSIKPASSLPAIITPTIIDGYSQTGASRNTLLDGDDAVIRIELDGSSIPLGNTTSYAPGFGSTGGIVGPSVLKIAGSDSTVTGLAINGLQAPANQIGRVGVWVSGGSNNHVAGNFIGTDVSGTLAPNGLPDYGYASMYGHSSSYGVHVADGAQHNFIGTDGDGVNDPAERNVISGNYWGVVLRGYNQAASNKDNLAQLSSDNHIAGNFIGTDRTGSKAIGNWIGIGTFGQAHHDVIGTTGKAANAAGERNVISGNTAGIFLGGGYDSARDASHDYAIAGNSIGVGAAGQAVGNQVVGILGGFAFQKAQIGFGIADENPLLANEIANNGKAGISLGTLRAGPAAGIQIRGNSMHDNSGMGIDLVVSKTALYPDSVTENDLDAQFDGDSGPNGLQNFPVLRTGFRTASGITIRGELHSAKSTTYIIDFYANVITGSLGHGEGRTWIGSVSVTTNDSGLAEINATALRSLPLGQSFVSATATEVTTGNTSEFSLNVTPAKSGSHIELTGGPYDYDGLGHPALGRVIGDDGSDLGPATITYRDAAGNVVGVPVNVGVYTAIATFAGDENYTAAADASASITINPAALTVTVNDVSRVFGQANPEFTLSYSEFVNGEGKEVLHGTPSFTTDATPSSPVGTYPVSVSGLMADNYTITFVAGTLTVTAPPVQPIGSHETATIGFWQGPRGQALLKSFNGGATSTALGNWLATSFPNIYGSLAGKTNTQVAKFYQTVFAVKGQKLDAQVMATAFNVYATTRSLGGSTAQAYGFAVTDSGLGARSFNVGSNGAAFGVANGTTLTVSQLLAAANSKAVKGVLYNGNTTLRTQANVVFTAVNEAGDIG